MARLVSVALAEHLSCFRVGLVAKGREAAKGGRVARESNVEEDEQ